MKIIDNNIFTLNGNFDLPISSQCTMNCKGCSYLDYLDIGNTIKDNMTLNDIKYICDKLINLKIKLSKLTFLGGEPTMNSDFLEMAKYIFKYKGIIYDGLKIVSNGTKINSKFLKSLKYFDSVRFSIYPTNIELKNKIEDSGLSDYIKTKCNLEFLIIDEFNQHGKEDLDIDYSKDLNWSRCWYKDWCRVITTKGIFRCFILYNHKKDICDFEDRQKLIDYIEKQAPFKTCEICPQPSKIEKWISLNQTNDSKALKVGLQYINKWEDNIYFIEKYEK